MTIRGCDIASLHRDQSGQTTIEWVLVVVAFVLPMIYVLDRYLLSAFTAYYGMVTLFETLPFP